MNTQKEVFNKLFKEEKTELATQKVELGSMEKLKAQAKECRSTVSKLLKIRDSFYKEQKSLKSFGEILQSQGKRLRELTADLKKKIDDLGVDTPKEINYFFDEANSFEATGKDAVKRTR